MVNLEKMPNELGQKLVERMLPIAIIRLPMSDYPKYDATAKYGYYGASVAAELFGALYGKEVPKKQQGILRELMRPLLREIHYAGVSLNVFVFERNNKQFYYDPESGNMYAVLETGQLTKVPSK